MELKEYRSNNEFCQELALVLEKDYGVQYSENELLEVSRNLDSLLGALI